MKNIYNFALLSSLTLILAGCNNPEEESTAADTEPVQEEMVEDTEIETENMTDDETSSVLVTSGEETQTVNDPLTPYSTEEIEYARIWLQFGTNPDVETIYVEEIAEGTPINPLDEGSLAYPEDVVQLTGSRLVDGAVTYSSNGDGTINLYNVPARWENPDTYSNDSAVMKRETRKIIEKTQLEYVDPGDDREVADMADRIR